MNDIKPFRVLCLDGGGMRGLYTAVLLDTLTRKIRGNEKDTVDIGGIFDLIVGTSTGGILATGLALGVPIKDIINLYRDHGNSIFPNKFRTKSNNCFLKCFFSFADSVAFLSRNVVFGRIFSPLDPKRSQKNLKSALDQQFGEVTMEELWEDRKIALCIPAVHMATQKPWIFKTPHPYRQSLDRDRKYKLSDICLATSAAPTFFPLADIDDPEGGGYKLFADGGLWCNNPSIVGLIEALEITKAKGTKQNIEIVSICTLSPPSGRSINRKNANLSLTGKNGWYLGKRIVETCFESQVTAIEFQLRFIVEHMQENNQKNNQNLKIDVVRLASGRLSPEQINAIGLDKADEDALNVLTSIAEDDAYNNILGKDAKQSAQDVKLLESIIMDMPVHSDSLSP